MPHVIFWLLVSHFAFDFSFQDNNTAKEKSRHSETPLQQHVPWFYWLTSHALLHGGGVALATGSVVLGALEVLAHWCIDYGKCERWYNLHADQALHLGCKALWVVVWFCFPGFVRLGV